MDDDDKKSEDEAAEPARDATQEEEVELREVSEEDLKRILAAHETWLETGGEKGKQADLSRTDLPGANLFEANLRGANLREANLRGADLRLANLQGAHLFEINLQEVDLRGANLQGADLGRANLEGARLFDANLIKAKGLTREQLDGACGDDKTKLPDDLADYQMKPCREPEQDPAD